jgi:hopanoid C-3 methylase
MKILLVRPPVPKHTMGLKHIMICEPLELEYTAANIHGHDIQILDLIVEKNLKKRLQKFTPDVVGSSCYITGVNEVIKIMREVKRWKSGCITVVGGVHAAQVPEDFADVSVDVIVRGDGTTLFPEIIKSIEENSSFYNIKGLAIPIEDGKVELTGERPYMPHADSLPFPRRDLIAHLQHHYYYLMHKPVATMKTAWGCWYKCNFCYTWEITDGVPYFRSAESIVEELEQIKVKDIYIVDDIFLIKPSRLARIAELIREKNIDKTFLVYARADFIAENEEIIKEWASLGLKAVFIGLEASTNNELDSMNKESTVDYNERAIEMLRKYKVDTYGSLIPNPDYTKEDWERLWQFIERTGLYYLNISPLTPLPGTSIWKEYQHKLTVPREAHGLWDLSHVLLPTKMPIKDYYRSLLKLYAKTALNFKRAKRLTQRTLPSVWSITYFRMLWGAMKIGRQMMNAHKHHELTELKMAMDKGPEVIDLTYESKFNTSLFKKNSTVYRQKAIHEPA